MEDSTRDLENEKIVSTLGTQNQLSVQCRENTIDEAFDETLVPEKASFRITERSNMLNTIVFNVAPEGESKIINEETSRDSMTSLVQKKQDREESGDGYKLSKRKMGRIVSPHVSQRLNRSEEYSAAYQSINKGYRARQRTFSESSSFVMLILENAVSPNSEVFDTFVRTQKSESVQTRGSRSTLKTSLHSQSNMSESAATPEQQSICSTSHKREVVQSQSPEDKVSAKPEDGELHNLRKEGSFLGYFLQKQEKEFRVKRRRFESVLSEVREQKRDLEKQLEAQKIKESTWLNYEKMIVQLTEEKKSAKEEFEASKENLQKEKENVIMFIHIQETAEIPLRLKYEGNREDILHYEDYFEEVSQYIADCAVVLKEREELYESLKTKAAQSLESCNEEWTTTHQDHRRRVTTLEGIILYFQQAISSCESEIAQKGKEKKELLEIHEQLVHKLASHDDNNDDDDDVVDQSVESGIQL